MNRIRYVDWQDTDAWPGHLEEFPDYLTQGGSLAEVEERRRDLHKDMTSGVIPALRRVAELHLS